MVYAISNIHGCYDKWEHMLNLIKLKTADDFYVLGDVVDYGPEPMKVLLDMMERVNVYPVMGEHEYKFLNFVKDFPVNADISKFAASLGKDRVQAFTDWIKNGGRTTFESYMALSPADKNAVLEYLNEFMLYDTAVVGDDSFVFTHAGIRNFNPKKSLDEYNIEDYLFDAQSAVMDYYPGKYMVVGHTPTFSLDPENAGKIFTKHGFIDIECGCRWEKRGGRLGCLRLNDMKEFYV